MSSINIETSIHICEDTQGTFDLRDILKAAGYNATGTLIMDDMIVTLPDGTESDTNTPLFGKVDADTIYVRPGQWAANYNGSFATVELVIDQGGGNSVTLQLQVIVDPVNDAPTGANKTFNLGDGGIVTLAQADFGFVDAVEHDAFQSVIITSLPTAGKLLLNGVAVAVNTEVSAADIAAGKLAFEPSQSTSGNFDIGFKVRDAGGTVGCNAADTSATPNYLTFKVPQASLGDRVWEDSNGNGVQDGTEQGVDNVTVTLKDASGHVVATTVTHDGGQYGFTVDAGTYTVSVAPPAGYAFTGAAKGGDGALDSDVDATGQAAASLAPGEHRTDIDAGIYRPASLSEVVWFDANRDGRLNDGEVRAPGITVTLLDVDGKPVPGRVATTDANGHYQFTDLPPGTYSVQFDKSSLPDGYKFTSAAQGGPGGSDADIDTGKTAPVTLASGDNLTLRAGLVTDQATVGDRVWEDGNGNGVQDAGEAGIDNVGVDLRDASGKVVATTTTHDGGKYSFNVDQGTYSVAVRAPSGYTVTGQGKGADRALDSDVGANGATGNFTVAAGQNKTDVDAGLFRVAKLGDTVWEDKNANGVQDSGEAGIGSVTVELKDATGKVVQTTTTGADGKYSFTADPGSYTVSVKAPTGFVFTGKDAGANDATDSDVGATGQSDTIVLKSGDVNNTIDAGLYKTATVGDRVWLDANKNGVQDSGEAGLADVKVALFDADGKQVGATVKTDASGNYQFTNLKPGSYSVVFDKTSLPEGMGFTKANQGASDATDSDVNAAGVSHTVTLVSGQVDKTVDAGVVAAATIGDRVWIDKNGNGVQDDGEAGKAGVTVELRDTAGKVLKTTTTDAAGNYKFNVEAGTYAVGVKAPTGFSFTTRDAGANDATDSDADASGNLGNVTVAAGQNVTNMDAGLVQKGVVGDKVWFDTNCDGIQQSNEAGARGVSVALLNEKGAVVATTVTDASGLYAFNDVGPGKYSVKFTALDGYTFVRQNQGSNAGLDSDADANGLGAQFTLLSGATDKTHDAGLVRAASIGDTVWEDANYNGVQDRGETGVNGVTVKLYDANNVLKATTVTTDGGKYLFDGLQAGNYKVEVVNSNGWFFTKADIGSGSTDSDITTVAGNTGRTDLISLATGENLTSIDAGIYRKGSIGDKVWRDVNHNGVQDSGEEGIGGVSVSLFDSATGKQLGSTIKTDVNGNYKFADLTPGDYYVKFDKTNVQFKGYNMSDWKWGVKNTGSNDSIDSDVTGDGVAKTNVTKTDNINISSGENDMRWDAAITPIAIDLDGDGIHTIARADMKGSFDLLGTGKAIQSGWLSKGDAFLAVDVNGNGSIDNISELFGGNAKGSGFAKLASYDSNGDGLVSALDAQFGSLLVWRDANSDGKTDAGELISLTAAGVASLKVGYTELPFLDANNNLHLERSSVTLANGKTADMTDVYFNVDAADAAAAGVTAPTIADLMQDAAHAAQLVGQCPVAYA